RGGAIVYAFEHLHGPVGALPAGGALATGLVPVELRDLQGNVEDRGRVVHDDDRARAEHRAGLGHRVEVIGEVEVLLLQDRRGGAAREPALHIAPLLWTAGEPVD